jgi:hypothetical protein
MLAIVFTQHTRDTECCARTAESVCNRACRKSTAQPESARVLATYYGAVGGGGGTATVGTGQPTGPYFLSG